MRSSSELLVATGYLEKERYLLRDDRLVCYAIGCVTWKQQRPSRDSDTKVAKCTAVRWEDGNETIVDISKLDFC